MQTAWQVGFRDENIRALCDVGRTTKQRTLGYIGQKGIGFKSVFKVTDAPQIHSGGFHLVFDLQRHSALGYVLPTWLKDSSQQHIANSKLAAHSTATKMVLPFKQVCCLHAMTCMWFQCQNTLSPQHPFIVNAVITVVLWLW